MKNSFFKLSILFFVVWFLAGSKGEAATVDWQINQLPNFNNSLLVTLNLDTDGQSLNTFAGSLLFDAHLLELRSASDKNSIIKLWLDQPALKTDKVIFSGITPNGFAGQGKILTLLFNYKNGDLNQALKSIKIGHFQAYLNNDQAEQAAVKIKPAAIVSYLDTQVSKNLIIDTLAPDISDLQLVKDPFSNKFLLIFKATDADSGLAYSAIYISSEILSSDNPSEFNRQVKWTKTNSPYLLESDYSSQQIYLKAVDNQGNVKIIKLSTANRWSWYELVCLLFIIIVSIMIFRRLFSSSF